MEHSIDTVKEESEQKLDNIRNEIIKGLAELIPVCTSDPKELKLCTEIYKNLLVKEDEDKAGNLLLLLADRYGQ